MAIRENRPVAEEAADADRFPQRIHRWNGVTRRRQCRLFALTDQERILCNEEPTRALFSDCRKSCFDLGFCEKTSQLNGRNRRHTQLYKTYEAGN
jgi:hypothetical protein